MSKLLFMMVAVSFIIVSCNTNKTGDVTSLSVSEFISNPADYVDQAVAIEGTVSHVCKHSGKRLFLYDANKDEIARIESSDAVPQFDAALVGGHVKVEGTVKEFRIDDTYLTEWEQEVMEDNDEGEHCTEGVKTEKKECTEAEKKEECKEKADKKECTEGEKTACAHDSDIVKTECDSAKTECTKVEDDDDEAEINQQLEQIENYRKQIAESGKDYIVLYYYIECSKVEEITEPEAE